MNESRPLIPEEVLKGLVGRLRDNAMVLHRLDRLESGQGDWLDGFLENEEDRLEVALEVLQRLCRVVSNSKTWGVLEHLSGEETQPVPELMKATEMGRMTLTEHLNDLVQVGLAMRVIDTDHAQATAAGHSMVQAMRGSQEEVAQRLPQPLARFAKPSEGKGNELPFLRS